MDSKERVAIALAHEQPDRVPINFKATTRVIANLQSALGCDYSGLLKYFKVDFREVGPSYIGPSFATLPDGSKCDIWRVPRREYAEGLESDFIISNHPLEGATTLEEIGRYPWPKVEWFDFSQVKMKCTQFKAYAVCSPGIHSAGFHGVFHQLTYLFGMEKAFMGLILTPDLMNKAIDKITGFLVHYYEKLLESAAGGVDFLVYKDDFGSQNGLMISREMFLRFFLSNIRTLSDLASSFGASLVLHSCGSIIKIIPDLIRAGVKVLDPIQVTAKDMDIEVLKERFGGELTFHGGIDVQHLMPTGTPDEIRLTALRTIKVLGKNGGYFFSPSHRFQADTPIENILALYDAALERPPHLC